MQKTKVICQYLFAGILSILASFIILRLWNLKWLNFPLEYERDALFYAMTIKSTIMSGWYLTNPSIGVPDGYSLADFPMPDGFHFLIIKFLSLFSTHWALVYNLFFLLAFPLSTITALFVLKRFGLSYPLSLTASLLFSLLPYHFIRGGQHLFLSAYFMVPLAIWLAVLIYEDKLFEGRKKIASWLLYACVCALLGSTGVYYAFFASFFILISGLLTSYAKGRLYPLRYSLVFTFFISSAVLINILPCLIYQKQNGLNTEVGHRQPYETETYGLKIAQLLLPVDKDRVKSFAKIKKKYNLCPLVNENSTATLGIIGSIGLLILIGRIFMQKKSEPDNVLDSLTYFNLCGILLATIGGFSTLFSYFISPSIRAYNRISIYLAFFALAAFFLMLQRWLQNTSHKDSQKILWGCSLFLLTFGIYNQTSSSFSLSKQMKSISQAYSEDEKFISQIDTLLPKQSMIFQLPYIPFPEAGNHNKIGDYGHFKNYLHSHCQRWSFGAIKGRTIDLWQKEVSSMPIPAMLDQLVSRGFKGLYLNRKGYPDHGCAIEKELAKVLNVTPYEGPNASFWDLQSYQAKNKPE